MIPFLPQVDLTWYYYAIPSILIVLDIVTGLIKGWGNYSSVKMREGLKHKSSFLLVLMLCTVVDVSQTLLDLGFTVPTLAAACVYISLTEILSCFENICELNGSLRESKIAQLILGAASSTESTASDQAVTTVEVVVPTAASEATGTTNTSNTSINTEETETRAVTVKVAADTSKEATNV